MTGLSEILQNANAHVDVRDKRGRTIKIKKINALDKLRLFKAAGPDLSQNDAWLNMAALAVSVLEIDHVPRPIPETERQIELAIMELGDDGLAIVADTLNKDEEGFLVSEDKPLGND